MVFLQSSSLVLLFSLSFFLSSFLTRERGEGMQEES